MKILITAGPTREFIDPVRFLSNASTGRMGVALAAAARRRGHAVTLVYGPIEVDPPPGVRAVPVISAVDMLAECLRYWPRHDALIMSAAVADFAPADVAGHKIKKSGQHRSLRLKPTPDILATLAAIRVPGQTVIGFALEDRNARRNAGRKLAAKGLDAIVLNAPSNIGAQRGVVEVLARGGTWQRWPAATKLKIAARLIRFSEQLHAARESAG